MAVTKTIISIIAITLTLVGYIPYLRDLWRRSIRPHVFSWFIWGIVTAIIFTLQASAGAGLGSLVTLIVSGVSFVIFFLGLKHGNKNIKTIDIVFLVLALAAIPLWLIVEQPVLSIILLCTIDILGFVPTVRKSWHDPDSETLSFYVIAGFRHGLSFLALTEYNIVTWLFPTTWVVANVLFAIMLIIRRRKSV